MFSVQVGIVCVSAVLASGGMLGGCVGADGSEDADVLSAGSEQEVAELTASEEISVRGLSFESVRVDGVLYSGAQFSQHFAHRDLHWVVTQETLDQDIPMAFSTEEKRNAALGLQEADASLRDESADMANSLITYARLYQYTYRGGSIVNISGNAYNLTEQSFNDKTSSVETFGRAITMYQHAYMAGCSFYIDWGLYLPNLAQWGFCGGGTWDNRTSSVRVW